MDEIKCSVLALSIKSLFTHLFRGPHLTLKNEITFYLSIVNLYLHSHCNFTRFHFLTFYSSHLSVLPSNVVWFTIFDLRCGHIVFLAKLFLIFFGFLKEH